MNRGHVFVSYSRHDVRFVDRLMRDLRDHNVQCWRDTDNIEPGANWEQAWMAGLQAAAALLVVLSRAFVKSKWVHFELRNFLATGRTRVIPILIDDVPAAEIPPDFAAIQWIDFRASYEGALDQLLQTLGTASEPGPVATAPHRERSKGYAFLSYAEEDADFVRSLKTFLKRRRYAYWDYAESPRDYHSQLFLELEGVITEAKIALCVLSESWKRSPWTVKEFFFSDEVGTPVFLLRAKPLGPTLAIAGLPYIDFTKDTREGFDKLKRELQRKSL